MKKLVIGVTLVSLTLIGTVAALPVILPTWENNRPKPVVPIDSAMRQQVVAALATKVGEHYVFPDKAAPIATLLNQRLRNGGYDTPADGDKLAEALTADMASVAHDLHMKVEFRPDVLPAGPGRRRPRHPTATVRLNDHFVGPIPNPRSISPITRSNREGVGVIPDIAAAPAEAMRVATAHRLRSGSNKAGVRPMLPAL